MKIIIWPAIVCDTFVRTRHNLRDTFVYLQNSGIQFRDEQEDTGTNSVSKKLRSDLPMKFDETEAIVVPDPGVAGSFRRVTAHETDN